MILRTTIYDDGFSDLSTYACAGTIASSMARIVILGGGITGMTAAYDLQKAGAHQVTLLERSARLGGKILTHHEGGLLIEGGPDSVFTSKPAAVDLMTELGLESEFVEPVGGGFSICVGGKLHVVPRALAGLIPSASTALESIGFLGAAARKRILSESKVAKGEGGDETIASFFRRRFGTHFSKTLAEPLLAGIHAGNAERLSMKALYPSYIGLEQKHGSLSAAVAPAPAQSNGSAGHRKPGFLTLRGGLQVLIDTLVSKLDSTSIRLGFEVERIERVASGGFRIRGTETIDADAIIVAIPASAAAPLLRDVVPAAYEPLSKVRHASTAVATFAYEASAFKGELHGNGFLVPADEPGDITGCTFSSLKWPDRSPDGMVLIRTFLGQDGGLDIDGLSDDQLLARAEATLGRLLKAKSMPVYRQLDRWTKAMPQYEIGHTDLMDQAEQALSDIPILLAGSSYRGTGIPDCIRQGREAARQILPLSLHDTANV